MRSETLCLIGFVSFFHDVTKHQASSYCVSLITYQGMQVVRHYVQGGKVGAACNDTLLMHQPYLTINGKKVPKLTSHITNTSQVVFFKTILDRNTKLGEYRLHSGKKSVLLFRIGYILCDPSQVAPEKICGKGQFCVINGSGTMCQQHLDCEMTNSPVVECENGKPLRKSNSSCSGYNNAKTIPQGYYLGVPPKGTGCELEPRVFYKGQAVQYFSTIPVSDNHDLEPNAWKRSSRNMRCSIGSGRWSPENDFSLSSNPNIAWPESLPAKTFIKCGLWEESEVGSTGFFILLCNKSARFSIVQKKTNIKIDVTNITKPEIWLDASHSCYCKVSVSGGLFVKALRTEENSQKEPVARRKLGWVKTKTRYCQLVTEKNKHIRLQYALWKLESEETYRTHIFHDESTVQINPYGRVFFYKPEQGHLPKPRKPQAKHPLKVHISGGISWHGRTPLAIFSGILHAESYISVILENTLLPHLSTHFGGRAHTFYQDNDRKHIGHTATAWFRMHNIVRDSAPPSSPDINAVELVWQKIKHELRHRYKPNSKESLTKSIRSAWNNITLNDCRAFINHIHKVLPVIVLRDGAASGY